MRLVRLVAVVLVLLTTTSSWLPIARALPSPPLPPLESVTFPAGTFVIPMDEKQAERILVFGFVHALLRSPNPIQIFRIIEPPNVTLPWNMSASPQLFLGGPFLVVPGDASKINQVKNNPDFKHVTVGTLTSQQNLNNIFRIQNPTKILVIKGLFGRTDITLGQMKIPFNLTTADEIAANPDMIFQYTLIVDDCFGWAGNIPSKVQSNIRSQVFAGNEVVFTDIAMKDLNTTFPGYVTLAGPQGGDRLASAYAYNPPRKYDATKYGAPADRFTAEFPSQYYNPQPRANELNVFTEAGGYVVSSIPTAMVNDVRILTDSRNFGPANNQYAILAYYFPYGNGIVEGLSFHTQQQVKAVVGSNGYYATYEWYGNKFVEEVPRKNYLITVDPTHREIPAGAATSYTVTITSIGTFSSPVDLSGSTGIPPLSTGTCIPIAPQPLPGGTASSQCTVSTSVNTPPGVYTLNFTGRDQSTPPIVKWALANLTVTKALEDFAISVSPTSLAINTTQSKTAIVRLDSIGSFSNNISLSITAAPGGVFPSDVTVTFTPPAPRPNPNLLGGNPVYSVMRISVGPNAHNGTYPLIITGRSTSSTGQSLTHSTPFTLIIPPPPPTPPIPAITLLLLLLLGLLGLGIGLAALLYRRRKPPPPAPVVVAAPAVPVRPQRMYVVPAAAHRVRCPNCGRPISIGSAYCPYCRFRRNVVPAAVVTGAVPMRGAAIAGRRATYGFILAMISAVLILLNAAALASPGFFGPPTNWSSVFFWLGGPSGIGQSIAVLIGLIAGFTVMAGGIMMIMRRGVFGAALVLPFAVISFIIGGGFIAGAVLGIVAGILGALGR